MTKEQGNLISRRDFLKGTAGGAATLAALSAGVPAWAQDTTNLDFVVWTYGVQTILDNIDKFEQKYPGISVKLHDFPWTKYHSTMVSRFRNQTPTDVLYNGGDWLPEWALAGWVVPLERYYPQVNEYKDDIANYAISEMTYNDKLYGLPYYADLITFMYNDKILKEHGIEEPPSTWDELREDARKLKEEGMKNPILFEVAEDLPNFLSAFWSMVYGRGERPFDDDNNPVFQHSDHAAYKQLEWYSKSINDWDLATHLPHETKVVSAMGTGEHAFTILFNYNLAQLNNPEANPRAGQFKIGLMPGAEHHCFGFAKFYCMSQMAAQRGRAVRDASWQFINHFGGKVDGSYKVAKRWAVEKGLGFAQLPLYDDPDVREAWSSWVDVDLYRKQSEMAWAPTRTSWYGAWSPFMRSQMMQAIAGEISVGRALDNAANRWNELKEEYTY